MNETFSGRGAWSTAVRNRSALRRQQCLINARRLAFAEPAMAFSPGVTSTTIGADAQLLVAAPDSRRLSTFVWSIQDFSQRTFAWATNCVLLRELSAGCRHLTWWLAGRK